MESHGSRRGPLPQHLARAARSHRLVVTLVREPISRALSRFWYWRSQAAASGFDFGKVGKARCLPLEAYIRRFSDSNKYMLPARLPHRPP